MNILYIHVFNADTNLTGFDDSVELSSSSTEDTGPLAKCPALMDNTEIVGTCQVVGKGG